MPAEIMLLIAAAKAALLIAAALLLAICARRASAAMRHAVLLAALGGALAIPLLGAVLPTLTPVSFIGSSVEAGPDRARLADEALLFLLVLSDPSSEGLVPSSLRAVVESWGAWILTIWSVGTAAVLLRIAADLAAARRAVLGATLRARLGPLGADLPLLECAAIGSPVVVGLFRPAILIPRGATLETAALRSVIAHELAHVERRDCLTQLVVRLACALYWFNPLVWHAAGRIALERERACDDRVLAAGVDPIAYSQLLIDMARRSVRMAARPHALPSMAQSVDLEKRIVSILTARTARRGAPRWCTRTIAIVACALVVPLSAFGVHDRPPVEADEDPYQDPQTERVDGSRGADRAVASGDPSTPDGALIGMLQGAAAREPKAPHDLVPDRARWALSLARDGAIIEPLMGALDDPDWRVRGYAAWALGLSRDPRAVGPLTPLLDDPVWRLRAMASFALGEIGGPRSAAALADALHDPAWQVRVEAVEYFGRLGEPRFRGLIEPLRNDPHIAVRLSADEALRTM